MITTILRLKMKVRQALTSAQMLGINVAVFSNYSVNIFVFCILWNKLCVNIME